MRYRIPNVLGGLLTLTITCVPSFAQSLPAGCKQQDATHVLCKKSNGLLPSGKGNKYGPYHGIPPASRLAVIA